MDGIHHPIYTLPYYDIRALQDIHDIISVEPAQPRDKVMNGMLASIGIKKGKPFQGARREARVRVRDGAGRV